MAFLCPPDIAETQADFCKPQPKSRPIPLASALIGDLERSATSMICGSWRSPRDARWEDVTMLRLIAIMDFSPGTTRW